MKIPAKYINNIKKAYKKETGKELSDAEAKKTAEQLMTLADILFDMWLEDKKEKSEKLIGN